MPIMSDLEREKRAWELLQWVPFSLPSEFDEDLALQGHYTTLQKQRSDAALRQWDKDHPYDTSGSELEAFRELESRGIYNQTHFFSPSKAKDGYYTKRLKDLDSKARSTERAPGPAARNRKARRRSRLT